MAVTDWLAYIGRVPYIKLDSKLWLNFWDTVLSDASWPPSVDESVECAVSRVASM